MKKCLIICLIFGLSGTLWMREHRIAAQLAAANRAGSQQAKQLAMQIAQNRQAISVAHDGLDAARQRLREALLQTPGNVSGATVAEATAVTPPLEPEPWSEERPYFYVPKKSLRGISVDALTDNFKVTPEIAALLNFTPEEQRSVQEALTAGVLKWRDIESEHAQEPKELPDNVKKEPGEKQAIRVPPLGTEGEALKADFVAKIRDVIGPQRSDLFLQKTDLESQLDDFIKNERTYTLVTQPQQDGTVKRILITSTSRNDGTDWRPLQDGKLPESVEHLFGK